MNPQPETFIEALQNQLQPVEPGDTMAEAGRKALLSDLIKMLQHEAGSRSGEDIEDVHDMRVATRRMRSTLRLLGDYFKPKAIKPFQRQLRKIAQVLGAVRDLDVLIKNVSDFQATLDDDHRADLDSVVAMLEADRTIARRDLIRMLNKKSFQRFVEDYGAFLTKPGKGAVAVETDDAQPYQVRHLLPMLLFEHIANVRAYDQVLADADDATLHALRIEFKRLRYAVSIFADVLGTGITDFENELKAIQDHLGDLHDIGASEERISEIANRLDPETQADALYALQQYVDQMEQKRAALREGVGEVWRHFNTKTVQRQLTSALAGL